MLLQLCILCLHLDTGFASCNKRSSGVYLWTAGHLMQTGNFSMHIWDWKLYTPTKQIEPNISPEPRELWTFSFMDFYAWSPGQPDYSTSSEECVNIWPEKNYEWNDEACANQYCFVCEDRNV